MTDGDNSGRTGPIYFQVDYAFEQLAEEGVVITFRTSERTTGDTWCSRGRGEKKSFDVHVEYLAPAIPKASFLRNFAEKSGFHDVHHWVQTINDLHGVNPDSGHLYRVTRGHQADEG